MMDPQLQLHLEDWSLPSNSHAVLVTLENQLRLEPWGPS